MLKIDNINSNQNLVETYTKSINSDNYSLPKGTIKDTFTRSTGEEDIRYSFTNSTLATKTNNFFSATNDNKQNYLTGTSKTDKPSNYLVKQDPENKLSTIIDESKPLTNYIGPDTENLSYYDDENTGDLAYQMLKNINKDIQKQIEFLNDYNLSKISNIFKSLEVNQLT